MRKLLAALVLLAVPATSSASVYYLCRLNTPREAVRKSINPFPETYDPEVYGQLQDPDEPDGGNLEPTKVCGAGLIRNATAPELAALPARRAADENLIERKHAKELLVNGDGAWKLMRAILLAQLDEINLLRQGISSQHPNPQPERTRAQALQAILDKIDTGEPD